MEEPTQIECRFCHRALPVPPTARAGSIRGSHERRCSANPGRQLTQQEVEAEWERRVTTTGEPIPVDELSIVGETRTKYHCILAALQEAGGHFADKQGLATTKLAAVLPFGISNGGLNGLLATLEKAGWIARKKKGKRTYNIGLRHMYHGPIIGQLAVQAPAASPPAPAEVLEAPAQTPQTAPQEPSRSPAVVAEEAELFGGERPGRWAARLERSLPELVSTTVRTELQDMVAGILGSLGFHQGVNLEEHEAVVADADRQAAEIARLQTQIEQHVENERRMQVMIDWLSEQEDISLRGTEEGQQATRTGLTVSQLPAAFKRTGAHAMEHGWSIHRTRGKSGHLIWRSPTSQHTYSPSTPSNDFAANQILWRKLRRLGLPDYHGRTQANADEGRWSGQSQGE